MTVELINGLLDCRNTKIIRFAHHSLQSSVRIVVSYRYNHKKKSNKASFFSSLGEPLSAAARFSSAAMLSSLPTEIPIHINS